MKTTEICTLSNTCDEIAPLPLAYVGCDWLSMSFRGGGGVFQHFEVEKINRITPMFKCFELLKYEGVTVFEVLSEPRMKQMSPDTCIIRAVNHVLYCSDFSLLLKNLLSEKFYKFSHIVRVDIFTDFQRVLTYSDPQHFVNAIAENKISKKGSSKMSLHGKTGDYLKIQNISFGRYSSRLAYKIYNKSIELNEVKSKSYIIDAWKKNNFRKDIDTWRIEFNILNKKINVADVSTSEISELHPTMLINSAVISDLFISFSNKYFTFVKPDTTITREYWKKVKIIPQHSDRFKLLQSDSNQDNTRSDRIFLKKMLSEKNKIENTNSTEVHSYQEVINNFVGRKNMHSYYKNLIDRGIF